MPAARKMTRRERDTIDSAYHESGHAVIALALGIPVSSVTITSERAAIGRATGNTQLDAVTLMTRPWSRRTGRIQRLAGFVADEVHIERTPELGESLQRSSADHIIEVCDEVGVEAMRKLLAETRSLVAEHWGSIEQLAGALLDSLDGDAGGGVYNLTPDWLARSEGH